MKRFSTPLTFSALLICGLVALAVAHAHEHASVGARATKGDSPEDRDIAAAQSSSSPAVINLTKDQVTPDDGRKLLAEFLRTQAAELKALEHRQKFEAKELRASQSARQKEWERRERDERHKFFADHPVSTERRAYIHEFLERRGVFIRALGEERAQQAREQGARTGSVRADQAECLKEFQAAINQGTRPDKKLWPGAN